MLGAIRRVLEGGIYLSDRLAARVLDAFASARPRHSSSPLEKLSDREFEVFRLFGEGKTAKEIAAQLHLSPKTVSVHRDHIKSKMEFATSAEMIRQAVRWVSTQHLATHRRALEQSSRRRRCAYRGLDASSYPARSGWRMICPAPAPAIQCTARHSPLRVEDRASQTRLLIVDDDPMIRELHALVLNLEGYQVETVADGAGRRWSGSPCSASTSSITDRQMPNLDGVSMLLALRMAGYASR